MSEQSHRSDPQVLNRRNLERDHRRLPAYLWTGAAVLDVGCGTGAITAGIARQVAPAGNVVGVDRDESLLEIARRNHADLPNLAFEHGDVCSLDFRDCFDVVTAARTLQWVSDPQRALERMERASKPGGWIVVLDYNHAKNSWEPQPPAVFARFYEAFLNWRAANGWDNHMADHLPEMFRAVGLADVQVFVDDERKERSDPELCDAAGIWSHVIERVGPQIVAAGFIPEEQRVAAADTYAQYTNNTLERQTLSIRTAVGRVG